jgi:transposase-like protein
MKYNNQFKMDVAIEVIQSKQSVSFVAKQYGIHPSTLYRFMNANFEEIIKQLEYLKYLKRMDRRDKKLAANQPLRDNSETQTILKESNLLAGLENPDEMSKQKHLKIFPTFAELEEMLRQQSDSESQPTKGQNQPKEQPDNTIEITFLKRTK